VTNLKNFNSLCLDLVLLVSVVFLDGLDLPVLMVSKVQLVQKDAEENLVFPVTMGLKVAPVLRVLLESQVLRDLLVFLSVVNLV